MDNLKKSKKRSSKTNIDRKIKKRKLTRPIISSAEGLFTPDNAIDRWGTKLPPEILLHIFKFVVKKDGALPFLVRYSKTPFIRPIYWTVFSDLIRWEIFHEFNLV